MAFLGNLKNTVVNAVNNTLNGTASPVVSKSDILGLEETERSRRINQSSQSHVDIQNAANVSGLIKTQSFPIFKGNVSKGYKRVTTRFEEDERRRRLTNKSESALRRVNANKTARMVQHLGWPFFQQNYSGPEYITMDPTRLLEEEERDWRTSKAFPTSPVKHNAAMVANILRWANFQKSPKAGFGRHLSYLSEKERRSRVQPDTVNREMENAYNVASLIKKMGPPFYVQSAPTGKRDFSETHKMEESERARRMLNPEEEQLAHELAGIVGQKFAPLSKEVSTPVSSDKDIEEQERRRRMADVKEQKLAQSNAKNVSLMVRESSSNKINTVAPMWFSISRNSMAALEEIERTRRLRDTEGQSLAKQQAKHLADIFSSRTLAPTKPDFHGIVEEERSRRILDRPSQQLAMKNARKVSGLVARHNLMSSGSSQYFSALEESERNRRLADQTSQSLAQDNARKVAGLISSRSVAPPAEQARQAPTESLPTYSAPASPAPTSINMPIPSTPVLSAPISAPIESVPAPVQSAPIQSAPVQSAPISAPIQSTPIAAPIQSAPIAAPIQSVPISAPIQSAPIQSAPIAAPIQSAPVSAPIHQASVHFAPVSAPIQSAPVRSAPITSPLVASTPVAAAAPLSSAPLSVPSYSALLSTTPSYSAPVVSAPTYSAPMVSAPVHSAPVSSVPSYSAPVSSVQPIVLPSTTNHVPVMPLASTTHAMPVAVPMVPADTHANPLHFLGERERRKLQKQVDRNNRKSERDVRKAEKSMLKAEKMHQKGRDDKAMKLESRAEKFMLEADHLRKYATGLEKEVRNAPAPASM